jgi:hypothetical protein
MQSQFGSPGKSGPTIFALYGPKPQLESPPKAEGVHNRKAPRAISNHSGGLAPTASGANSVASALGASPGATQAKLCQHNTRVLNRPSEPELSTWLGVGTFYLALTPTQPDTTAHPIGAEKKLSGSYSTRLRGLPPPAAVGRRTKPPMPGYIMRLAYQCDKTRTTSLWPALDSVCSWRGNSRS